MSLRPFLLSCVREYAAKRNMRGVTIAEFLVSVSISGLIAGMIVSMTLANRAVYQKDIGRTLVNQNIRTALDIVGNEVRQSGELFPSTFPAILITDNGTSTADTLTLRRNLLSQVLVGCDTKTAGTSYSVSNLSRASAGTPACTYANQRNNYNAWFAYVGGQSTIPQAYIFNQTTRNGEFLQLRSTTPATNFGGDTGALLYLNYNPKTLTYGYAQEATSIYVLNEWKFQVANGVLQIIENGDTANPKNIIDGITNFQVSAIMQDGTTKNTFVITDTWTNIQVIRVSLTGSEPMGGRANMVRTVSSDFFPRNVLSN